MGRLYQSPLRVYLCLAGLALWGLISVVQLPVSLFPNSSKPRIWVGMPLGGFTAEQFMSNFGRDLEARLKGAEFAGHEVEKVTANYSASNVDFTIEYKWGTPAVEAKREIESVVNGFGSRLPKEIRDGLGIGMNGRNTGFLAITFFSSTRSLDELYRYLDPLLTPRLAKVTEAADVGLWNPNAKEVRIELSPEKMALLQLTPRDVSTALEAALQGFNGGTVTVGLQTLEVSMPPAVPGIEALSQVPVVTPQQQVVHLGDLARIDFESPSGGGRVFKTSGVPSLILFGSPRAGGNIKKMSEDIVAIVEDIAPQLPKDIQYRFLVDPSEFIRSAVNNVMHEVILAALLAVLVLFVFIGNFRNVITAAIEIPMSIVMAFIWMRWFDINLNLISLGGLALSAGMNVDASVVVMENIFRHFEEHRGPLDQKTRLRLVMDAVAEVRFPVIASTIASLVVFLPLAMTAGLTNAILSDLAMAVVFSHGLSAFVALILVPTVRLQMMSAPGAASKETHSPIEPLLRRLEAGYARALGVFIAHTRLKQGVYAGLIVSLILLLTLVLPRLPKEIVGKPDTDWMILSVNTSGNSTTRQMEGLASDVEARLLKKLGHRFQYTFAQIHGPNSSVILARLQKKSEMQEAWKELESEFTNTPTLNYYIDAWNPSEMQLPDPPAALLSVRGNDARERALAARELLDHLQNKQLLSAGFWAEPNVDYKERVLLRPDPEQWSALARTGARISAYDIADLARVATNGRFVGEIPIDGVITNVVVRYPENRVSTVEDLAALPIGLTKKIVPLKALANVRLEEAPPTIYREDGKDLVLIKGNVKKEDRNKASNQAPLIEAAVKEWQETKGKNRRASVVIEDPSQEMNDALRQLAYAVGFSILLIFITMVLQFGNVINALLVLVAVPLGLIGVIVSLFVLQSTLSLNSVLGVILLNGISVANSIILVDFLTRLVQRGKTPAAAALEAAQKRLRPILMTSMTTGLGMLPIALGMGEGGRILQPLGIAVIGGLGFSMALTLFVVPSLQVSYLNWKRRNRVLLIGDEDLLTPGADDLSSRGSFPSERRPAETSWGASH